MSNIEQIDFSTLTWVKTELDETLNRAKDALKAYVQRNTELAYDIITRDNQVDRMYNAFFKDFLIFMTKDLSNITCCMHLHFIAKNLERIGDHVTAIAEQVVYIATGALPRIPRRKSDLTSHCREKL